MADERIVAQLVFEALDRASRDLRQIADSMEAVGVEAEEAGDKSEEGFRIAGLSLTDFKSGLNMVQSALQKVAQGVKQMVEFAELGASAKQAELSFAGLAGQMGLSAGYMQQLRDASRDTITDLDLMAGIGTLVAGTTDDFGGALAAAYPSLVEYAKAAAKLNPHLGDTAFMLESISTGIKRGSPLILDNLGLTIKVGEANQAYADQLGKTVAELTAEEKQMALLNDAMRAGDRLIEQVGGSTESLTDSFEALRVSTENAKTEYALWWSEVVKGSGALEVLADRLEDATDRMSFGRLVEQAEELGVVTDEEIQRYKVLRLARSNQAENLEAMAALTTELTQRIQDHNYAIEESVAAIGDQEAATQELTVAQVAAAWAAEHSTETIEETTEAHRRFAEIQEDDRRQTVDWTDALEAQADAQEDAAKAAEVQAAALAKVAEARRELTAAFGDEFDAALELQSAEEGLVEIDLASELYEAADAAGAGATTLALLAAATGDYTDEQIQAALRTAALREKIEEMAAAIVAGDVSIGTAIENIKAFDDAMDALPDETVVVDIEVAVADVENEINAVKAKAARLLAKHQAGDEGLTITPVADTSAADAALEATAGKADDVTDAVEAIPDDVPIDTQDAIQALEDTTTEAEDLLVAIEEIPTAVSVTIHSNLTSEIAKAERLKRLLLNMPDSPAAPTWTGYDDDPTSLH